MVPEHEWKIYPDCKPRKNGVEICKCQGPFESKAGEKAVASFRPRVPVWNQSQENPSMSAINWSSAMPVTESKITQEIEENVTNKLVRQFQPRITPSNIATAPTGPTNAKTVDSLPFSGVWASVSHLRQQDRLSPSHAFE